jgi:hypothetical protein
MWNHLVQKHSDGTDINRRRFNIVMEKQFSRQPGPIFYLRLTSGNKNIKRLQSAQHDA